MLGINATTSKGTHLRLDTRVVEDEIRVADVDEGAHARIDDLREVDGGVAHPVAGVGEVGVHVVVGHRPVGLGADGVRDIGQVVGDVGRVGVGVLRQHVVDLARMSVQENE